MKKRYGGSQNSNGMAKIFMIGVLGLSAMFLRHGVAGEHNGGKALLDELRNSNFKLVWASKAGDKVAKNELYVSNADGSEHVNITNSPERDEVRPRVNPKTNRIAFAAAGKLHFIDMNGGNCELTEVDNVGEKDWSPDGTKMAISFPQRNQFGFRIYCMQTKKVEMYGKDKNGIIDIDWSPNGNRLAFATRKELGFRYTILTMNIDGTNINPFCVGGDDKPYCHPSWHPTLMRLAWNSQQGLLLGDFDPNATGQNQAQNVHALLSFKAVGWEDPSPRWSPDGAYIAYINKGKRMHVVRTSDAAWVELDLPKGWIVEMWDYDWLTRAPEKNAPKADEGK